MSKQPVQQQLFRVLALSLIVVLLGGGIALLNQWHHVVTSSHAATSGDSVVGSPSLPAATVDSIFRQVGSHMVGVGPAVEAASRAAHIDDAFALAAWWVETNDGEAGVGLAYLNPGSVRGSIGYPSGSGGYTIYPSYTAAVNYWFPMLQKVYIARGLTTVSAISHPYVGTSTSYLWADKVAALMQLYRGEAPPPAATTAVTPTPTLSAEMVRQAQTQKRQDLQEAQSQSSAAPQVVAGIPPVHKQQVAPPSTSGLEIHMKLILVIVNLLLALGLGLWAVDLKRRYGKRVAPAPAVQAPISNVWEQLRISQLQPSAFLGQRSDQYSFNSLLPTTEGSSSNELPAKVYNTETLEALNALQSASNTSKGMPALGSFAANQLPRTPLTEPAFAGSEQRPFETPLPVTMRQLPFASPTPVEMQQLPFETPTRIMPRQLSFEAPTRIFTGKPPFNSPIPVFAQAEPLPALGQQPFDMSNTQTQAYPLVDISTTQTRAHLPTPGPLRRTRLQPQQQQPHTTNPIWPILAEQIASVDEEQSTGLLSRYREV